MNNFRHLLKAAGGHPPIGTWITSASPIVAEAVGHAGFDWGLVDMAHAPLDYMDLVHLLQAIGNTKMTPVVRVPANEPVAVQRVLDAGAQTLLFPLVECAADARRAVAATRHAPQGVRSMATLSRATRYGAAAGTPAPVGVIVELETPKALSQLEEVVQVDGVDAVFIGPADLSAQLGHAGHTMHPEVMRLMGDAAQRCRHAGIPVGTVGATPDVVTQFRAMGFSFVAVASDLALLMRGAQAVVQSLRTPDGELHVHSLSAGTRTESSAA
ncbi:HpcH/HpaI aldolase family protein [Azohydromonas lata]|uniref:Aldolase/citrate lyase family protein n=1 Tax=Azohydromonas lata TaxID=45677 RepID=A0ABU5IP77_9BURK|nr:aldolase/citrate lyase family protein [Azohydromonas lata]MDZ5460682.1 aldolase/citrate lyase family protein [Azohydromonas lata]